MRSRVNSLFASITYFVGHAVVDPGDTQEWSGIDKVLLTHTHFDHIYGLNTLWEVNREIKVYTNFSGRKALLDPKLNLSKYQGDPFIFDHPENIIVVEDMEIVDINKELKAQAVFTPGHNDSCITWIVGNLLFTGDAYIPGIKVVTNLPGADKEKAARSIDRILKLTEGREICPGHQI